MMTLGRYDTGKKIKGRKWHIATNTLGHLIVSIVHAANIQDRDGGYAGDKLRKVLAQLGAGHCKAFRPCSGFCPAANTMDRGTTSAWLERFRRLNRNVEATLQTSQAWLIVAHIRRMLQKQHIFHPSIYQKIIT